MPAIYMLIAKDHSRDRAREAAIRAPEGTLTTAHA